ncbi:MAG TPA: hypothetical protein VIN77_02205 [Aurantimonas sp.]|uniref:Uncharacterized protein n=1 Tax=Aurantimonas marianensis TaxID=2920428 RepID=A0A9X2H5L7_9HYPH|nr:hypothetical protein [Aurantimonas marianensis]MCP3054238.1 hypothetical protein [Aurantimonas marianensis]
MQMELRTRAEVLDDLAGQFDTRADSFWKLGRDFDRWGLSEEAIEARKRACAMRVGALINRAKAAGLSI